MGDSPDSTSVDGTCRGAARPRWARTSVSDPNRLERSKRRTDKRSHRFTLRQAQSDDVSAGSALRILVRGAPFGPILGRSQGDRLVRWAQAAAASIPAAVYRRKSLQPFLRGGSLPEVAV